MISFDNKNCVFTLNTPRSTYAIYVDNEGYLRHVYYGKRVSDGVGLLTLLQQQNHASFVGLYRDNEGIPRSEQGVNLQEFGSFQAMDYRYATAVTQTQDGIRMTEPRYKSHRIYNGKPEPKGLPHAFATEENPAETLEITLLDARSMVEFVLSYTVFEQSDVIVRSNRAINSSSKVVKLERLMSFSLDLPSSEYDLIHFTGEHASERQTQRQKMICGEQGFSSVRSSSGHQHNPTMAVVERNAKEDTGDVYGMMLVYSGSFCAVAEVDPFWQPRLAMGINPDMFEWELKPGEDFHAPEALIAYSGNGLSQMSHSFHDFLRGNLIPRKWSMTKRPLLVNNWEATYFSFTREKLLSLAQTAKELGIEMLVLDDGWFGARDNDLCALGDWFVNESKIGNIKTLVEEINQIGLKFGLWYEPEMISQDSELYRRHPEWALSVPATKPILARQQMVLDMANPDVVDYLFEVMSKTLKCANIEYVKWDMNRNISEHYNSALGADRQGEYSHRYVLGVYNLHERLLSEFPNLLIEGCSGGGGRFDAGILAYSPQIWCSDNSDAIDRLSIQYGTSFFYPASTVGAHVSVCPNHQTGRTTPLSTRINVALAGTFGYELDLTKLSLAEREEIIGANHLYHRINHLVTTGDYYRLKCVDGSQHSDSAWQFAAKDASETIAVYVVDRYRCNGPMCYLKLKGLIPESTYVDQNSGKLFYGDTLMNMGLPIPRLRDGDSLMWHFVKK